MRFNRTKFIASMALAALASSAHSAVVFSLANNGNTLIRFDSATPGVVTTVGLILGDTNNLQGLDFRPKDGLLYGYSQVTSGIYRVDTSSGATTLVNPPSLVVGTPSLGIDFNPVPDRLRVVTALGENQRINADTGAALSDTTLAYAAGDPNFGSNPSILDAAYTNHDRNPGTGTTLYYIDSNLNTLVTTLNPNAGVLNTVGALGVNTSDSLGFDIFTDLNGVNTAYASLQVGGVDGLYTINLATGAASFVGAIGAIDLFGLAVAPVPEPGSLALLAAAGLAAFGLRRRDQGNGADGASPRNTAPV